MTATENQVPATLDAAAVTRWCRAGLLGLRRARAEIDTINVYPVADGDTGTNMCRTMEAVVEALREEPAALPATLRTAAHAALLGARGNSGVILAQLLRGLSEVLGAADRADGPALAAALRRAADLGYAAVGEPVEGTVLTVARAAADGAGSVAASSPAEVARAAAEGARDALARTPEMLDVLARAGVVDAGGRGLVVLLEALVAVLGGAVGDDGAVGDEGAVGDDGSDGSVHGDSSTRLLSPSPGGPEGGHGSHALDAPAGPSYEVMYLLDASAHEVESLRARLATLGDSLVVVGGEDDLWNVHVHVDDAGAAIEAGLEVGSPHRIQVTHLDATVRGGPVSPRRVVSLATGEGLAGLLRSAGALVLVATPDALPSPSDVVATVQEACAREVVLLPNDVAVQGLLEEAAAESRRAGVRVTVLPTRSSVQGLAALAVHDPARDFDDDVVAMTAAAGATRYGEVTVAAAEAVTSAGICRPGDVLGLIDGDVAVIGTELAETARTLCTRLLAGGGEMVTLVRGSGAGAALTDDLVAHLHTDRPEVDVVVYDGGQPGYPLLMGVE